MPAQLAQQVIDLSMERSEEKTVGAPIQGPGAGTELFNRGIAAISPGFEALNRLSLLRPTFVITLVLLTLAAVACTTGTEPPPVGAEEPPKPSGVTVPDDISGLDFDEVERRLGRLLGDEQASGQAAPVVEPTAAPEGPTLEEILALLNATTPVAGSGEVVISVSPETLAGLTNPLLTIKSPPSHGSATVISERQILYLPDGSSSGEDEFEYELFDGDRSVFSQVMEFKR